MANGLELLNRTAKSTEEVLDEAGGLDWKTMVRCDKIHLLPKARFDDKKAVSLKNADT